MNKPLCSMSTKGQEPLEMDGAQPAAPFRHVWCDDPGPAPDRTQPGGGAFVQRGGHLDLPDHHPGENPGLSGLLLRLHRSDHHRVHKRRERERPCSAVSWPGLVYGVVALLIYRFGVGLVPPSVAAGGDRFGGDRDRPALAGMAVDMASTDQMTRELPKTVKEFHALPGNRGKHGYGGGDGHSEGVLPATFRCRPGHPGHRHRRQHLSCGDFGT